MEVHPGNDPARRGPAKARPFKKGEALNAVNEKKFSALMHLADRCRERSARRESEHGVDRIAVSFQGFRVNTPGEERIVAVSMRKALSRLLLILLAALLPAPAAAAVDLVFYSKEFGGGFPHAFVALQGVDDRNGVKIDTNYGFTATHISPAILLGSVRGEVMTAQPDYVGRSDAHFAVTLSDAELDAVTATIERWRTAPQPSYNLDKRNCVFFVADIAETLGMKADRPKALMRRPRSYIESLTAANRDWLTARSARFLRERAPAPQPLLDNSAPLAS